MSGVFLILCDLNNLKLDWEQSFAYWRFPIVTAKTIFNKTPKASIPRNWVAIITFLRPFFESIATDSFTLSTDQHQSNLTNFLTNPSIHSPSIFTLTFVVFGYQMVIHRTELTLNLLCNLVHDGCFTSVKLWMRCKVVTYVGNGLKRR